MNSDHEKKTSEFIDLEEETARVGLPKGLEILTGLLALYNLIVASRLPTYFGLFIPPAQHRAINLVIVIILVFYLYSIKRKLRSKYIPWYDVLVLLLGVSGAGYAAVFYGRLLDYSLYGYMDTQGVILASLAALVILEMVRRVSGWTLPLVIGLFLLMTVFQNYLPGVLFGKGYSLDRLTYAIYVGSSGIFGVAFGVATTILIVYIIFARLLQGAGGGQWFIDIALSLTGWMRGGPAKAAVVASGFFGMISGSPSANVASVGSFTIPLMKSVGYRASFAGAVEAVASTGGQFMPPVMGAVAFIMAEWLNIPYTQIAIAAFVPAVLYYIVLFMSIHFESARLNLSVMPRETLPSLKNTLKKGWHYLPPIVVLLYLLLFKGYSPEMAAIFSIIVMIGCSFFAKDPDLHLRPGRIWKALVQSVQSWLIIGSITTGVGILIGSLELSGLSIRFTRFILDLSGGDLLPTLMLVGLASFILGMGLDSIPSYITLASIAAPALVQLGVPAQVAHLYVMYWGLSSFITPPVCLAVYVACGISGSKVWETGWEAVRLGIAVFLIPFAFVYNRALLLQGTIPDILISVITALLGAVFVAAAMRGYINTKLAVYQRLLLFAGGLFLIGPGWWTALVGLAVGALGVVPFRKKSVSLKAIG